MNEPITITASALFEQIGGLVRALLLWGAGYAVAKGWLHDSISQAAIPVIMTAGALAWQQIRIRFLKAQTVKVAAMLPDEVLVK